MLSAGPRARRSPRSGSTRPLAHRGVHRQGSWLSAGLGAVRRVVAAPLSWLGGSGTATSGGGMDVGGDDEVEELDVQAGEDGKRRRGLGVEGAGNGMGVARDSKRRRMGASEYDYSAGGPRHLARQGAGYLDPPEDMFNHRVPERARTTSGGSVFGGSNGSFTFSAAARGPTMPSDPRASFTTSPPSSFVASSREQSVDSTADSGKEFPPKAATMVFPLSRQATARGSIRELSLPPATGFSSRTSSGTAGSNSAVAGGQPYRMRTTPALGVQTIPRYQRASTPSFIGRPSEGPDANGRMSTQPTLGDILEQQRSSTRSPTRQSTMLIDNDPMQSWAEWEERRSATPVGGASQNDRLLLGLDVFKTPLLPSRLKQNADDILQATGTMPDVLRRNKVDVPVGDHTRKRSRRRHEEDDDADMPKLGLGKKREKKTKESKPYGGSGSTKKMLTKMRQEAEVQADDSTVIERDFAMKEDQDSAPVVQEVKPRPTQPVKKTTPVPPATVIENEPATKNPFAFDDEPAGVFKVGGLEKGAASGRVGREKSSSNSHAPSARLTRKPAVGGGARFSGRPEDLGDDSMETATPPPATSTSALNLPKDFSFGPPASAVFAQPAPEASTSKQAPVSALPFSLGSKPMVPPTPPIISISPATPDTTPAPVAKTSGGIPNFFSKSAATKMSAPEPPKMGGLFGSGAPSFGTSAVPATPTPKVETSKTAASPFSFGTTPAAPATATASSPFTLGGNPSTTAEAPKAPAPLFGAPAAAKADEVPKPSPFSFGAPAAAPKAPEPEAVKSSFSFTPAAPTSAPAVEAPKAAFSFGSTSTTTPAAVAPEPPKTAFTFGAPAAAPATPAPEAPKALFGMPDSAPKPIFGAAPTSTPAPAFTFGQSAASAPEAPKDAAAASTSRASTPAFQFGAPAAPSTPAPADKKPTFTFATGAAPATPSTPAASPFVFGAPATPAAPATEAPKAFQFGVTSTPAPKTPPKQEDNEMSMGMDESPTRGPGMDIYGNAGKPTTSYFGNNESAATVGSTLFGNSSVTNGASSSFGSTSGSGFGFGQKVETPAASNPFNFGQQKDTNASGGGFSFGQQKADAPASGGGGFSFGNSASSATSTSSGFNFGKADTPAPASGGGFAFGSSSSLRPPAAPPIQTSFSSGAEFNKASSPFSFGAGPTTAPPTTAPFNFGGASNAGSAPASPSTFASQPFAFGSPSVQPQNGFGFGSQPASPAVPTAGLPGGGFSFGGGQSVGTPPPSSHGAAGGFGSPAQGSQPLFNIGSAPPPPSTPGGSRQIKKMPARRGTATKR